MKERPILFSGEMMRAILDGRKSQTRRVIKTSSSAPWHTWEKVFLAHRWTVAPHPRGGFWAIDVPDASEETMSKPPGKDVGFPCPYGQSGDCLWVREGWRWFGRIRRAGEIEGGFAYRADDSQRKFEDFPDPEAAFDVFRAAAVEERYQWRSPIHMPRWASRLTLEITGIRVEMLQEITEDDARAEGIDDGDLVKTHVPTARHLYSHIWDSLNEKRGYSWESNPWVWVIEFGVVPADFGGHTA